MDKLTYNYKNNTNQLLRVRDAVPAANYTEDIDDQPAGNYAYDAIGNLTQDTQEGVTKISWTVYACPLRRGKIESIEKSDGTTINYSYDAAGNRINKTVAKAGTANTTIYVRDAQGNVLSIYEENSQVNSGHFTLSEQHLYGSSRLGIYNVNKDLTISPAAPVNMGGGNSGILNNFERNKKLFELTNHLGNVLATISDEKIGVDINNDGLIDYYKANVVSAQDYYPFGMAMPARTFSMGGPGRYRYGFNGKENDKDITPGAQDYGMRINENRLGRFFSVDPLAKGYPMLTPYQYASNRPIDGVDLDGLEYITVHAYVAKDKNGDLYITKKDYTDFRNMTAEQIKQAHGMSAGAFYLKFSKSFGKEGRGIKWVYRMPDGTVSEPMWEMQQKGDINGIIPSASEMEYHGVYSGGGCITTCGPLPTFNHQGPNTMGRTERNPYDFGQTPIDIPDDFSKTHDMMQDGIVDYQGWLEDTRTLTSDNWLNRKAADYLKSVDIGNSPGMIPFTDKFTGRRASTEAVSRAQGIMALFGAAIAYKNFKIARLNEMGLDPNGARNQGAVTLDDWKPKWHQFKQRAQKAILEASGGGKTKEQMAEYWKPGK